LTLLSRRGWLTGKPMLKPKKGPPEKYVIPKLDPPETFYWGPEIDRETALSLGLKRFFTGEPCLKGHVAERWVKSRTCVECVLRRHRVPDYRETHNPTQRAWIEANPDRIEVYNANRRAKRNGG
jgi:hypothetical protein